eukprot:CAMPEP_0174265868 /NCGR_PEP_ID=MMETSP0439-20130205/28213_1 /TAXON_ID=0 /ORGANISM="Stereomyxa ramosa, Strain Chinc5" /LENGTH=234 /DNA_ID=CAMNT_0015352539 /DNA_START=15 /DNA_END=716 /DNA_ORIENTATION=-
MFNTTTLPVEKSTEPFIVRKSEDRGHANHGWLNSYHTFSFANYYDPSFNSFGSLRVINEDIVKGGEGFGSHPHRNFEIFSYVIDGALEHKDSLGNREVLKRGDVQFTSAGSGIVHSEYNASKTTDVYFLQIWVKPNQNNLDPEYQTKHFSEEAKQNSLCLIVSGKQKQGSEVQQVTINQDVLVYASLLESGKKVNYTFREGRMGYLHLCNNGGKLRVNDDIELEGGDGLFIKTD